MFLLVSGLTDVLDKCQLDGSLKSCIYMYLSVSICHGTWWRSQDNLWGLLLSWCASDSVMWIPGVGLRLSGIAASRFTCRAISWAPDGLLVSYIMVNTRLDQLLCSIMLQHLCFVWKSWNERNLRYSASIGQLTDDSPGYRGRSCSHL